MSRFFSYLVILLTLFGINNSVLAADCPTAFYNEEPKIYDPWESFNHRSHDFNMGLYVTFLRPISDTYRTLVPTWGRNRVKNFISNLGTPVSMINYGLQGNLDGVSNEFWRFFVNSTFGIGGLFDFSQYTKLKNERKDFNSTLYHYNPDLTNSRYLVLPIIGPSTLGNVRGLIIDNLMDPVNYIAANDFILGKNITNITSSYADNIDTIDNLRRGSLDEYATIRSVYLQNLSRKLCK
jgi:phospholipid-binding lipoprotein MlaA